jgi:hypothetical protein
MNTLPTKWYIEATEENREELNSWRLKNATQYLLRYHFAVGHTLLSEHHSDKSCYFSDDADAVRDCDEYKDYQEITLEQFRAITNPVPEHWYIEVTEDNREELNRWRLSKRTPASARWDDEFVPGATLVSEHPNDGSYFWKYTGAHLRSRKPYYKPITLEQFRQIINSKPMSKTKVKSIQISRELLNEYYEASTREQKAYLTEHFKLDGTTTDEAIRGLYDLACWDWKPKIKANHSKCFPEDSKYFDFSKHTNQYGCDSIISSDVADSLGLYRDFIEVRSSNTENNDRSFYLDRRYNWELVNEGGDMVLIPTKKVK